MANIKIICDSLSDLTDDIAQKYDIDILPLNVIIKDKEYKDGVDLKTEDFYKILVEEKVVPKTSQITFADFYNVFDKYTKEGQQILYISASRTSTGTSQSAMLAANEIENGEIVVYDSNTLCFGISQLIIRAGQMNQENCSMDEILEELDKIKDDIFVSFSCNDLEYLCKGGRISGTKAKIGTLLSIKPICIIENGIVSNVAQARGKKNVVSKIIDIARKNGVTDVSDQTVYIGYTDDIKERDKLKDAIEKELNAKKVEFFMIGAGIGTHSGPGATGFICMKNSSK